ncbi:MAG TPA: UvrD-helicase domain-containing protein [Terriglobia bacterium]|nr:UvrD-helicase domain-containing protein [Terriglobia bacterium]
MKTSDAISRERIRSSLDETLIVEAAAGTGKTSELVRRIAGVLRTGRTTVNRVVAVTFMRKAAGELRLRLRLELDEARREASSTSEIQNLENALKRLEEARIGTIHSFCAEILRQRPVEARIAPGFEELDQNQSAAMYERAFDVWIQSALENLSPGLRRVLSRISLIRTGDEGSALDQLRTAGNYFIEWRDFPASWRRDPFDREHEIDALVAQTTELAQMVSTCESPRNDLRKTLQCVIDFVSRRRTSDYDYLEGLLLALSRDLREVRKGYNRRFSSKHSRDEVVAAKDQLHDRLREFERKSGADLSSLLQVEMRSLVQTYEELKARSGKLDFGNLLIRTRDLIRDNARVRGFLQEQFTHIFVDEFQDTDPIQAEILTLLSADDPAVTDWRDVRPKPGKLFLVGDPKQSIYRFRRADIIFYQDICQVLRKKGAELIYLSQSFRSVRPIQEAVNAAFEPEMKGDPVTGQPSYVPLEEFAPRSALPAVIALPVPAPYGKAQVAKYAIEASLPDATGAFVEWLLKKSGWSVRNPDRPRELVPVESRHVAILFRRFMSWETDMTRDYIKALENRDIPHLLWGARSFHEREEVETVRAALNAIEWPDDALSVYATLKGSLFAIPDNLLLRYRIEIGPLHPFRPLPEHLPQAFNPIREALAFLADLHRRRNWRSAVETFHALLEAVRAHAAFALRPAGHQVLLNVNHIADLARGYERSGGISFRGFVEQLNSMVEREGNTEPPVMEDAADGVRIMTVHAAKGLEFPIVILADMTANIAQNSANKYIDPVARLAAIRVLGCSPWELLDHEQQESARDEAEGIRVAYVAATRARDLLVVPAVGDLATGGWLSPLSKAIYPEKAQVRNSKFAPSCPAFGETSVLWRPSEHEARQQFSVKPGLHKPEFGSHDVIWWDPTLLKLNAEPRFGLDYEDILAQDQPARAAEGLRDYEAWKTSRTSRLQHGSAPSLSVFIATDPDAPEPPAGYADRVQVIQVPRTVPRPKGRRFGELVHLVLRDASLTATKESLLQLSRTHGRLLAAIEDEIESAPIVVFDALQHPFLARVRQSPRVHRELPITLHTAAGPIFEGVIDLAFLESAKWIVTDFKTDVDDPQRRIHYRRQVAWYVHALEKTTDLAVTGCLLHI